MKIEVGGIVRLVSDPMKRGAVMSISGEGPDAQYTLFLDNNLRKFYAEQIEPCEVAFLQTRASSRKFHMGGNSVIKLNRGNDADRIEVATTGFRKARFYPPLKVSLSFADKKYYLSCEFSPGALTPVVAWLEGNGMSKKQICELAE